jgi:hypothetical protein
MADELALPTPPLPSVLPVRSDFLLGYLDLAIAGTLEYPRFQGLYLTPWRSLPLAEVGLAVRGWVRTVYYRPPLAEPQCVGRLLLMAALGLGDPMSWLTVLPEDGVVEADGSSRIELRVGDPRVFLFLLAKEPLGRTRLELFAKDVSERFRRQMD